ncbi:hypothetical protein C0992_006442 [Termitomyces sp. T32_za158]|nr:hypothetical protein C0992_006442 [Termitomyces sp. T32_za158]
MESITFNTARVTRIEFQPEWRGRTADTCTAAEREQLPLLANGGHRLDLLREMVYAEKLKVYNDLVKQLAQIEDSGKGRTAYGPLDERRDELRRELEEVTWIAQILDLDKIEAHSDARLIKIELASNKTQFQVQEKALNSLILFFDALNSMPGISVINISTALRAVVEHTETSGKQIVTALSSVDMTYAYARLCFNHYFRHDMPFSLNTLRRWRRVVSVYAIPYIRWMALTFEFLFSTHDLTLLEDVSSIHDTWFSSIESRPMKQFACNNLREFDMLDFSDKRVRFDLLDDDFYGCLLKAYDALKNKLDTFGLNSDQLSTVNEDEYAQLFVKYSSKLYSEVQVWVEQAKAHRSNDDDALAVLNHLLNKLYWLVSGQLGGEHFYPSYDTPHPIVITEFIIPICDTMVQHEESLILMAGQFEPMIQAFLAQTTYDAGTPTLYSVLRGIQYSYNGYAEPHEVDTAINSWIGSMFRFRFSGLEDIRRHHATCNQSNAGENKAPYLIKPKKSAAAKPNAREMAGIERIKNVLTHKLDMLLDEFDETATAEEQAAKAEEQAAVLDECMSKLESSNDRFDGLHRSFMENPIYHCYATDPNTRELVKTLKKGTANALETVYKACIEELGHSAKFILQPEYDYCEDLSVESQELIANRVVILHEMSAVPTLNELIKWHSPGNMRDMIRTENDADPDVARLKILREKRSKQVKKAPVEIDLLYAFKPRAQSKGARASVSQRVPKGVSASQQARDEALMKRIDDDDLEKRSAEAKGKGKAVRVDNDDAESSLSEVPKTEDEEDSDDDIEEGPGSSSIEAPPGNQAQQAEVQAASTSKVVPARGKGKRVVPARSKRTRSDATEKLQSQTKKQRTTTTKDVRKLLEASFASSEPAAAASSRITAKGNGIMEARARYLAMTSSQLSGSALDDELVQTPDA